MKGEGLVRLGEACEALARLESAVEKVPGQVIVHDDGPVRWVRLDAAAARNAMSVTMMRQLAEIVVDSMAWDGAFWVLAAAEGGAFCSGGNLKQVSRDLVEPAKGRIMTGAMQEVLDAVRGLPAVSVSVLEGPAVGGGVELASATDLRVGSSDAWAELAQVRLGVAAGWGGARRIAEIVGRRQALRWMVNAERWDAQKCSAHGFFDAVVDGTPAAMLAAVLGPALGHSVAAVRAAKAQVEGGDAAAAFLDVWGSAEHRSKVKR